VQLGLIVAGSCSVVARLRAAIRRDGGPVRWFVSFAALYRVGDKRRVAALLEGSLLLLRWSVPCLLLP
jgi:hypothetical protein